jgi:uncharacterized repeat protein (TIGR03803 family)
VTKLGSWKAASAVLGLCTATAIIAPAQTFTTLVNFDGTDGASPYAALTQGPDGNFYGTTPSGGIVNSQCGKGSCGTAFEVTSSGMLITLYEFCSQPNCTDGYAPYEGLTLNADNDGLYGTTSLGGVDLGDAGTVFKIMPSTGLMTLYDFCTPNCESGALPSTTLVNGADGYLYGATDLGGSYGTFGNLFKMTPAGNLSSIFSFDGRDGQFPNSLLQASDGNFYGTTTGGGRYNCPYSQNGCGTVFRITRTGNSNILHSFCSGSCLDGYFPTSLMQATDGNLYGTTMWGGLDGPEGLGTIFRVAQDGSFTVLYNFCSQSACSDGIGPQTLVQGSDGNLYGTTQVGGDTTCNPGVFGGCGTVFRFTLNGVLTTLHTFEASDGAYPRGLNQATEGNFYGITQNGGSSPSCNLGCGTVYSLDVGLDPFVTFVRAAGKVGQTGGILGQGFTGTTSVSLNGISATFTVKSDTFIEATVPAGATTGYVTVTTPSGTLTSNVPFRVIK